MDFDTLAELMVEMPLNKFEKIGDESSWETRGSYDKKSAILLQDEKYELKVKNAFEGVYSDLNFYFLNNKEVGDINSEDFNGENGNVGPTHSFWEATGLNYSDYEEEDAVSIIFVGNFGDQLVPLTPWILAHRISHTFLSSRNIYGIQHNYDAMRDSLVELLNLISEGYGMSPKQFDKQNWVGAKEVEATQLLNKLGTFKSARDGKVSRPYEFIHEIFAQQVISGEIKFNNDLTPLVVDDPDEPWEEPYERKFKMPDDGYDDFGSFERTFEYYIDELWGQAEGGVFIM